MKKKILLSILIFVVMLAAGALYLYLHMLHYSNDEARRNDVAAMEQWEYEVLVLPIYGEATVNPYPFEYFMGAETYLAEHDYGKLTDLSDYLSEAVRSCGTLTDVYAYFDPVKMSDDFWGSASLTQKAYQKLLYETVAANSQVNFVFILPAYSLEYWCETDDADMAEAMESYLLFCNIFQGLENVRMYYFGHLDWVIANRNNYVDPTTCTETVINRLTALTMPTDTYKVTAGDMVAHTAALTERVAGEKASPAPDPGLSEYEVVFFGDSIIGNYSGSLSIPGIFNSMTGAESYNCAIGGQSASAIEDEETGALDKSLNYFLTGSPTDVFATKEQFRAEVARFREGEHQADKLCFVLEYGLNDYFAGRVISNPADENDITTYSGAMRTAVRRLQEAYPEAVIVLLTPTYTYALSNATIPQSEVGGPLSDYVAAVKELGAELGVPVVDNFTGLGVDETNWTEYIEDGTHYNDSGRYLIAGKLAEFLSEYCAE